jgi:hypothetical protein
MTIYYFEQFVTFLILNPYNNLQEWLTCKKDKDFVSVLG